MHSRTISGLLTFVSLLCLVGGVLLSGGAAASAQQPPTPQPLYALPTARLNTVHTSGTLDLSDTLRLLAIANPFGNSMSIVAPVAGELIAQVPVLPEPRNVAITGDGLRALVTHRTDAALTVIDMQAAAITDEIRLGGVWAHGVVVGDNDIAYVSMQGSSEIVLVDLAAGEVAGRIPTPAFPTALALWGDFLYVTHLWSGDISLIYLPQSRVVSTVSTGADTGLSTGIDIDITRGMAYLPQTRANNTDPALTYDTTVFPVVNVMALDGLTIQRASRITPNTAARPSNMPYAVELDASRQWLYVANAGSNDVMIIETVTGQSLATLDVGANPRGLRLNGDSTRLYVHNMIDGTLSTIDTARQVVVDTLPINPDVSIPVDVLIGAELFYGAVDPRMAEARWISCANCHLDGMTDGLVWEDMPGGPRNTPLLYDLRNTAPYNWSGTWDELADVELKIRELQAGDGLLDVPPNDALGDPHAGLSLDLDTLVIYMDTLQGPVSPNDPSTPLAQRGREVFEDQSCTACHALPTGTNRRAFDVGTGGVYDTPTVRWLWLSAPYFHDGSAQTLYDVFALPGAHQLTMSVPSGDIDALVAYLLTVPSDTDLTD